MRIPSWFDAAKARSSGAAGSSCASRVFEDAWVHGHNGQVVDAATNRSISPVGRNSARPAFLAARQLDDLAFSLIPTRPGPARKHNYFHYLVERLPEHLIVLRALVEEFGRVTVLLPSEEHPFDTVLAREIERRFPDLPTLRVGRHEKYRCKAVAFHRVRRSRIFPTPVNRRILREAVTAMRHAFDARATGGDRRLFVSRADANTRRVLNEDEVFGRLERHGFERVTPGRLPLAEQIALFSEAQIVVGTHGAGLTNIVFMPEGGRVIETFGRNVMPSAFVWLSHLSGHAHAHIVSDETEANLDYRLPGAALDSLEEEIENAL